MINLRTLKNLDRDDLLNLVGLESRRDATDWLLPAVGFFTAGVLVGAGLGLMLAPKAGNELRDELRNRLQGASGTLGNTYSNSGTGIESKPRSV
jgi:hypothetical protein